MPANNFKAFSIGAGANVTTQADYEALAELVSGFQSGKASSAQINKAIRQGTVMASVLAQFIANTSGADVLDNGDTTTILANYLSGLKANLGPQLTGVIGDTRNAKMNIPAASATATFTADELIVGTALGGPQYRIGSFNKTINIAITGAGGMDTGAITSAYVAIYAIYNPTTGVSALLGFNPAGSVAPNIYAGANMPAGFTASALVSVWLVASSLLVAGSQSDRECYPTNQLIIGGTAATTTAAVIVFPTAAFPMNAKTISGYATVTAVALQTAEAWLLARNALNQGYRFAVNASAISAGGIGIATPFSRHPIYTPGTLYYAAFGTTATSFSLGFNVTGYTI